MIRLRIFRGAALAFLVIAWGPAMAAPQALGADSSSGTGVVPGFAKAIAESNPALSDNDKRLFAGALDAIARRNWPSVLSQGALIKNPHAAKLINWAYLSSEDTRPRFEELVKFTNENLDWPLQEALLAKAERALPEDMPPARLIAWFAGQEPFTGEGMVRLGDALLRAGQPNYGIGWLQRAWSTKVFDRDTQRELFAKYGQHLKGEPSAARMNLLLWESEALQAEWLLPHVPDDLRRIAQARIALKQFASNAEAIVSSLPSKAQKDPGVLFDVVRYLRRKGEDADARRKLLSIEKPDELPFPAKWWIERHVIARKAIEEKEYQDAYAIVSHHGLTQGAEFADAEWLSGWLALRFLDKPKEATEHFERLDASVTYPISSARAEYWLARAHLAAGDKAGATAAFTKAARFANTYYGQLSAEALAGQKLSLTATPGVDPAKWDDFLSNELVKTIGLIKQVDEDRYMRTLAYHIAEKAQDDATLILLSEYLWTINQPAISLRIAKRANQKRVLLPEFLYPVFSLPRYPGTGKPPEPALVLGLARQESEFNPLAVSAAGARGLMQLLPSTAQITARKHGVAYKRDHLLTDPSYNMQLGMAHMADLLERFDGSYILMAAAYNAGAMRIEEWIGKFGDPRAGKVDPIDWVELIPFTETRNYVQRVLENTMVYRHRIAGAPVPYRLSADLKVTLASPAPEIGFGPKSKLKTAPPIAVIEPKGAESDADVVPEAAPSDDPLPEAAPSGPAGLTGPAVPQKVLDAAPGSIGVRPAALTDDTPPAQMDQDVPATMMHPDCRSGIKRPNSIAECMY